MLPGRTRPEAGRIDLVEPRELRQNAAPAEAAMAPGNSSRHRSRQKRC
jgi:hypothetical protein